MINMLKDRLEKAKIGKKPAEKKLIDGIAQVRRGTDDLSVLDSELQHMIKEATDWLATKGVDIQSVLKTEKNVKV
jgi:Trp operon repressor